MKQISMKQGLWCRLQHEQYQIAVHCSLWSGKEVVYVNDHPVSIKRNIFRLMGKHHITLGGKPFTIEIDVENPFTYKIEVRLKKGPRTIERETVALFTQKKPLVQGLAFIGVCALVGIVFGYFAGKLYVMGLT